MLYKYYFCVNVSLSKCFSKIDCKRKNVPHTPSPLVMTLKLLATNESCEKQQFFEQHHIPALKKLIILLNLRYLVMSLAPNDPTLTLSWKRPISYRKQSIDLLDKSMDWFLHDIGLRHERVNLKSESVNLNWINLKCKTDCFMWRKSELQWSHIAFQYSAQWSVEVSLT